ncbi:MAG: hypothetical protein NZ740_09930 [Kiritimatiellae bacterium]|nr:hypothetical protein [Kiritimatiellia bacterium]MDW8459411.1 hypothetical protein [Verrucomicrobiota bacterium]
MKKIPFISSLLLLWTMATVAHAANLAADDASDPAYSGGWGVGLNGGYGFGAWILVPPQPTNAMSSSHGFYIGSSTANADGWDDASINGLHGDLDIDTGASSPAAWGMYANTFLSAFAIRPFTGGPLSSGQTFSVDFDNGYIQSGGEVSLGFLDADSNFVFRVYFTGGLTNYYSQDYFGILDTGLDYGDEGLNLTVVMTSATNYLATITRRDSSAAVFGGSMSGLPVAFGAVNQNAGEGTRYDFFINSMSIVPEPSVVSMIAIGLSGLAVRILMRRKLVRHTDFYRVPTR